MEILYKSKNWVIKWSVVKLENQAGERELVGQLICVFGQRQELMQWFLYDVIMMSFPVESPKTHV